MRSQTTVWFILLAALVVTASLVVRGEPVSNAAPPRADGVAGAFGLDGWERSAGVQALYNRALGEGSVTLYTEFIPQPTELCAAFTARFPGIECLVDSFTAHALATVYMIESSMNKQKADVLSASTATILPLRERGFLPLTDWEEFGVEPFRAAPGERWVVIRYSVVGHTLNKTLVPAGQEPRTIDDLLAGRWRDEIAAPPLAFERWLAYVALDKGLDRALEVGRALRDDQELLVTSASSVLVDHGEKAFAIANPKGGLDGPASVFQTAPLVLDLIPITSVVAAPVANAPHPNAARLLTLFLLSEEAALLHQRRPIAPFGADPVAVISERFPRSTVLAITADLIPGKAEFERVLRDELR